MIMSTVPDESSNCSECGNTFELLWRGARLLCVYALVVATPACVTALFLWITLRAYLFDAIPIWNDELVYWHGILTFLNVGFNGGYYVFNELSAQVSFTHFDPHGPWYFAFLGVVSSLTGWSPVIAIGYNLAFLSAALIFFLCLVRPSARSAFLLALFLGSFWPITLFVPIAMQESLHQAIGVVLAACFFVLLKEQERLSLLSRLLMAAFLFFAAALRSTWILLFPAFLYGCLLHGNKFRYGWRGVPTWALTSFFTIVVTFVVSMRFMSPYPDGFVAQLFNAAAQSLQGSFRVFVDHFSSGVVSLKSGDTNEIVLRLGAIFILVFATASFLLVPRWRCCNRLALDRTEATVHLLNVGIIGLFLLAFYDIFDWRDYRVLAPHILFATLLSFARKKYIISASFVLVNLSIIFHSFDTFTRFHQQRYRSQKEEIALFAARAAPYIRYDASTDNAWCNTVLTHAIHRFDFPAAMQSLPAGIGFTILTDSRLITPPIKSKYLILDDFHALKLQDKVKMNMIVSLGTQKLFRNLEARCD
jgi:hypothetical protein